MKSLWKEFCQLGRSYYDIEIKPEELFSGTIEQQNRKCVDFIEKHFKNGKKSSVLDFPFYDEYMIRGKHIHTVFLFLMGIVLKNIFKAEIRNSLSSVIDDLDNWYRENEFLYSWFMCCLFHDAASCIENDYRNTGIIITIDQLKDKCLNTKTFKKCHPRFSPRTICNYFEFDKKCYNEQDHGIIGGCYLFDRLINNFEEKTRGHCFITDPYYSKDNLNWCKSQKKHFAYVADAIICHNMWTTDHNDKEKSNQYRNNGLDELIIDAHNNDTKLSLHKNPLSFMLCLLDTIEPTKRLEKTNAKDIAENLYISYKDCDQDKYVTICWSKAILKQSGFHDWLGKIEYAQNWISISVSERRRKNDMYSIEIVIPG